MKSVQWWAHRAGIGIPVALLLTLAYTAGGSISKSAGTSIIPQKAVSQKSLRLEGAVPAGPTLLAFASDCKQMQKLEDQREAAKEKQCKDQNVSAQNTCQYNQKQAENQCATNRDNTVANCPTQACINNAKATYTTCESNADQQGASCKKSADNTYQQCQAAYKAADKQEDAQEKASAHCP